MTVRTLAVYAAAAALTLASGPSLLAQERPSPGQQTPQGSAGARPNSGGESHGSAGARPSGGSSGSSASSPSSGSSGSMGAPVGSGSDSSSRGGGTYSPVRPERRPENRAGDRNARAGSAERRRVGADGAATPSTGANEAGRRAVPAYSRPRDGRPVIGTAGARTAQPQPDRREYYYDRTSYYNRYPYGFYSGYGYGVGYFYDPWMWGYSSYYDPYYAGGGYGYTRYSAGTYRPVGGLRLKVKPVEGQVYVDGYYVGEVDSFDGIFQKLTIEEGAHRIEIHAPGFETVQFEVMVVPGETVTYKGELKRIQ